jgi:CO/xanthine dehydrogenase Mo-binding subunit
VTIGERAHRIDAQDKTTGQTRFGGDLAGPGALWVKVIRSPHPHAKIGQTDFSVARQVPGVVGIYSAADIDGTNLHGLIRRDQQVFATDRVRYLGDALGIVVAETMEAARTACAAVCVVYEALPIIDTVDQALAPGAPLIHPEGNVLASQLIRRGDAPRALAEADVVVEGEFRTRGVDHAFLDLEAGMAELDGDTVVIHASGQWIHEERRLVALALGLPLERVRIVQPATGGAFGGREDISIQIYLGLAVLKHKRPVRMEYTRSESMVARHKRHPVRIKYTMGAKLDGTITAAKVQIVTDEGAYTSTGPAVLRKAVSHCTGPYRVPNIWADGQAVFTNACPTGAMRGFGACQLAIAYEGMLQILARKLKRDPVSLRAQNLLRDGEEVTTGQRIVVAGGADCLEAVAKALDWSNRDYQTPQPYLRRGYGVSSICFGLGYGDGFPDAARARVRLVDDGSVEVYTAAVEFGQGVHTMMAQVAANELGVDLQRVRVIASDTHYTPESGSSSATRQTVFSGNAIRMAAAELAKQVLDVAAHYTGLNWDELELRDATVVSRSAAKVCMPLAHVVRHGRERRYELDVTCLYQPRTVAPDTRTGKSPRAFLTYMFASHGAEVLVDMQTGEVRVERIVAAHDVGKAINPQQVEGQIEGGVVQGLGMALMEELVTKDGRILNDSFTDYLIPTIIDAPRIETVIIERDDPEGPYGARGVGEPALIGTPPAILAAIADAIGAMVTQTPATAERVWRVIQSLPTPQGKIVPIESRG